MDDKLIMEDILTTVKGAADLYLHGTIESATINIHQAFDQKLNDTLQMQNEIYSKMSQRGWYAEEQAEQQKVDQTKQKFSA
ncbi:MAG: spore coat protein [Clostridiales bacterium]|nr:spore coat protein [Clostridiales bacterium]MDD7309321.1 spore coat protein [Eubacteriales bacterium]MDY5347866.1 spore coat protein [Eubacteriales bacterium]